MKTFLAIALLLAGVLPAAAQTTNSTTPTTTQAPPLGQPPQGQPPQGQPPQGQNGPRPHMEWSEACKAKIAQMCPEAKPGMRGAVRECLQKQNTTFAQVCPAEAAAFKAEHPQGQPPMNRQNAPASNGQLQ